MIRAPFKIIFYHFFKDQASKHSALVLDNTTSSTTATIKTSPQITTTKVITSTKDKNVNEYIIDCVQDSLFIEIMPETSLHCASFNVYLAARCDGKRRCHVKLEEFLSANNASSEPSQCYNLAEHHKLAYDCIGLLIFILYLIQILT
jgi:hypothetical protein